MIPTPLVWLVGEAPLGAVREVLGGIDVAATTAEGPWRAPAGKRPVAVLLIGGGRAAGELATYAAGVGRRAQVPVVVCAEGLDADGRLVLMRAGLAVEAAPWEVPTGSSRERAAMRLARAVHRLSEADGVSPPNSVDVAPKLLVIGASTGGPGVLRDLLTGLAPTVPVLIAQHISLRFDHSLAEWLTAEGAPTRVATDGDPLAPGVALLAPADRHLAVDGGRARLLAPADATVVPSVDVLFDSVARGFGRRALGVLLTGMGDDGARGLLAMKRAGGWTITQRGDTCIVDGMPARARDLGAACEDLSPADIRARLMATGALRALAAAG